jgi:hypothetical protein
MFWADGGSAISTAARRSRWRRLRRPARDSDECIKDKTLRVAADGRGLLPDGRLRRLKEAARRQMAKALTTTPSTYRNDEIYGIAHITLSFDPAGA